LARAGFAAETAFEPYWILLDFLGFSRPNRDLSMGCTGFSLKKFSRALCLLEIRASWRFAPPGRSFAAFPCERQTGSSDELNLISDFAQLIVAPTVPFLALVGL
jgi:hypothetical protein